MNLLLSRARLNELMEEYVWIRGCQGASISSDFSDDPVTKMSKYQHIKDFGSCSRRCLLRLFYTQCTTSYKQHHCYQQHVTAAHMHVCLLHMA